MRLSHALLLFLSVCPAVAADDSGLLSPEERQWLESLREPLIVATETQYHPYNFVDEHGKLSGVVGDYIGLLEDRLGIQFEVRVYPSFAEVLEAAQNREVDIVPLIVAAPERRGYLDFSDPVYQTQDRIFTRRDTEATLSLNDLAGMRVGMGSFYALQAEIEANHPEIILVPMATEPEGLFALSTGRVDALISEIGVASHYIQTEAITNLRVAGEIDSVESQTIAIRNDLPMLKSIINKGLASISAAERQEIDRRWINIGGVDPRELDLLWKQVGTVVGLITLLLIGVLIWTLSLRRLVARRTDELRRELSERQRAEAARERLAVAVQQSAEYVIIVNTAGNIEYANLSFLEAHGAADLVGRPFDSLAAGDTRDELFNALRATQETGSWTGQTIFAREAEGDLKVRMTIAPIYNDQDDVDGYVATGRDVTKEEELESQIRQAEKLSALGTLAGGIAHDFNNLLVPILGHTDLIRLQSSDGFASNLDAITEAGERARDLVQRILTFGRGGTSEMQPLDLRFEIEDSISFLRSLLPTTIKLQEELSDCGAVLGDRTQLQQILLNLCTNASDAMAGNGGTLTIKLEPRAIEENRSTNLQELAPGSYAVLTVSDTGIGMTEDTKANIFDPYFTEKQQAKGTGLGLATVHGIVNRHGGTIQVYSAPDMGASFRIYLPAIAVQTPLREMAACAGMPRGDGQTIMLIDDDELVLEAVKMMLQGLGYEVSEWSDSVAAFNAFRARPNAFDAILTDFTMPDQTGVQLTRRAQEIRPDIPVAVMTGDTGMLQDYDQKYIAKPIPLAELADCLHELLE